MTEENSNEGGCKNFSTFDITHILYLGGLMCEAIEEFRDELLKNECELVKKIFQFRSYHRLLSLRDRFEEVVLLDQHKEKGDVF